MSKPVCLLWLDDFEAYKTALADAGLADRFELHHVKREDTPPDELIPRVEILAGWKHGKLLARMPKLRWIQAMTAGVEAWIDAPGLRDEVMLCCARGSHRHSMSENILGALFHLTKPYMAAALDQKQGQWNRRMSKLLAGQTLGILGLGRIGEEIAARAKAFKMNIRYHNRNKKDVPYPYDPDVVTLAKNCDVLVAITPGGPETKGIVNAAVLDALGPQGYFVNVARGSVVDQPVLLKYLQDKKIAGAGLDVYYDEPDVDPAFFELDNAVLLPHMASATNETRTAMGGLQIENILLHLSGKPVKTPV